MSDFVSKRRAKERTDIAVKLIKNIEKIKSGDTSGDILSETKTLCEYFDVDMDLMLKDVKS